MRSEEEKQLDNPVWHSLKETHKDFILSYENLKCYDPEFCAFGGYNGDGNIADQLNTYAQFSNNFFIVGEKPAYSKHLKLQNELVCLQMVYEKVMDVQLQENIVKLDNVYEEELSRLVNLVQPGYYKRKTSLLGDYFGILKNEVLVAVTGERMKMNLFTEVSAVVTDPDHKGKGYASQLIAHTVKNILLQNKVPYLHVTESNIGAIRLYEKLGFRTRRKISFWHFTSIK